MQVFSKDGLQEPQGGKGIHLRGRLIYAIGFDLGDLIDDFELAKPPRLYYQVPGRNDSTI